MDKAARFDKSKVDYTLYLCTDRQLMSSSTIEESVTQALDGGCSVVQLREKDTSSRDFLALAKRVKLITEHYGVPLIINDRFDIAMLAGADGVHLGQSDLPCDEVRRFAGEDLIIGVSAARVDEAVKAQADGADYLGVGAMYATSTKTNTRPVSQELLREIRGSVEIPIVAIGGIKADRLADFKGSGINGFAVVSAVVAQADVRLAAEELRRKILACGL